MDCIYIVLEREREEHVGVIRGVVYVDCVSVIDVLRETGYCI